MKKYCAEHPVSDETRAKRSSAIRLHFAKKRAVRGLLAALIRVKFEIFSHIADGQRVQ